MTTTAPDWIKSKAVQASSLSALAMIALEELTKVGDNCALVCGPVSSGGMGNVADNLAVFNATIASLRRADPQVFDTLPFEAGIIGLRNDFEADPANAGRSFLMPLMSEFYQPLCAHPALTHAYFIPGWEASFGSTLQRGMLIALKRRIVDLPADWSRTFRLAA